MGIARRTFLLSGLVGVASSVWAETAKKSCLPVSDKNGESTPERVEWHRRYDSTIIKNRPVLGYMPRPRSLPEGSLYMHRIGALALHDAISNPNLFIVQQGNMRNFCDGSHSISIDSEDADDVYNEASRSLMSTFAKAIRMTKKMSYTEVVDEMIDALRQSFTTIDYEVHTDLLGIPKTLVQLTHDNKGDCKDFALARYMFARGLGVKAEHLMLLIHAPIEWNVENPQSHANMAVYHPAYKEWVIIDGTGRDPLTHEAGGTTAYQNDTRIEGEFLTRAPTIGITHRGVFELDSLRNVRIENNRVGYDVVKRQEYFHGNTVYLQNMEAKPLKKEPVASSSSDVLAP